MARSRSTVVAETTLGTNLKIEISFSKVHSPSTVVKESTLGTENRTLVNSTIGR